MQLNPELYTPGITITNRSRILSSEGVFLSQNLSVKCARSFHHWGHPSQLETQMPRINHQQSQRVSLILGFEHQRREVIRVGMRRVTHERPRVVAGTLLVGLEAWLPPLFFG